MRIIKVNATDSTNQHLKRLLHNSPLEDYTILVADLQHSGRGQAGTLWKSDKGKNLTISVLKRFDKFLIKDQFLLSMAVSLGILHWLKSFQIPELSIKWPNDILSGSKKLCGILIENNLKGKTITHSIMGLGININQLHFEGLPNASSLKKITGKDYNLEQLLPDLVEHLRHELNKVSRTNSVALKQSYEQHLFQKDQIAQYRKGDQVFNGTILGVSEEGNLVVEVEKQGLQTFTHKEIQFYF